MNTPQYVEREKHCAKELKMLKAEFKRLKARKTVRCVAAIAAAWFAACCIMSQAQAAPAEKSAADASAAASAGQSESAAHPDLATDALSPKVIEEWSTPSLSGSHLEAGEPIVGPDGSDDPSYTLDMVRVQWRVADPIDLYIMKPAGIAKPPVILYLYSYPFDNDRYLKSDFRKFLTKKGFAAVGFVSALTGQRYHAPRPMKQWFVSQLQESLATSAHDVQLVLDYIASRGDMDMDHVGMFGEGSGASIAILAAAVDPRIKTLDLVNPWGDWPEWIAKSTLIPEHERPDYLKPEFLAGVAPLDPVEWLPKLKTQSIRLTEVDSVTVTPAEARQKIEAAFPKNAVVLRFADTKAFLNSIAAGTAFDWVKQSTVPGVPLRIQVAGQAEQKASPDHTKE